MEKKMFPMLVHSRITKEIGTEIVERMPLSALPGNAHVGYKQLEGGEGRIYFYGTKQQFDQCGIEVRALAMGMLLILLSREDHERKDDGA